MVDQWQEITKRGAAWRTQQALNEVERQRQAEEAAIRKQEQDAIVAEQQRQVYLAQQQERNAIREEKLKQVREQAQQVLEGAGVEASLQTINDLYWKGKGTLSHYEYGEPETLGYRKGICLMSDEFPRLFVRGDSKNGTLEVSLGTPEKVELDVSYQGVDKTTPEVHPAFLTISDGALVDLRDYDPTITLKELIRQKGLDRALHEHVDWLSRWSTGRYNHIVLKEAADPAGWYAATIEDVITGREALHSFPPQISAWSMGNLNQLPESLRDPFGPPLKAKELHLWGGEMKKRKPEIMKTGRIRTFLQESGIPTPIFPKK